MFSGMSEKKRKIKKKEIPEERKKEAGEILKELGLKGASKRDLVAEFLKYGREKALWKAKRVFLPERYGKK